MIIIGCDFHTRYQQIAMANDETGELLLDRRLVAVSSPPLLVRVPHLVPQNMNVHLVNIAR